MGGVYNGSAPSPASGQGVALQQDANGNLLISIAAGSVSGTAQVEYLTATALPTAATVPGQVEAMGDKFGRGIVTLNGMRDIIGTAAVQNTGASGTLIGQIGSTFTDIIQLVLTNETGTACVVSVSDGTTTYKFALAANGGASLSFNTPLPATSTNTNWTVSNSASCTVDCVVIYAKNK